MRDAVTCYRAPWIHWCAVEDLRVVDISGNAILVLVDRLGLNQPSSLFLMREIDIDVTYVALDLKANFYPALSRSFCAIGTVGQVEIERCCRRNDYEAEER